MSGREAHNALVSRVIVEMGKAAEGSRSALNVMAESLLYGVALLNYPSDPRRQALIIQEIADAAADRATMGRHP